jgi:hypothetical protein
MSDTKRRPATEPMYYDDGEFIHACESSEVRPGVRCCGSAAVSLNREMPKDTNNGGARLYRSVQFSKDEQIIGPYLERRILENCFG